MFVSLLQLMGFPAGKPVHSRATEKAAVRETGPKASIPQEQPDRRSIVKTSLSKAKKPTVKSTQPAKAVKAVTTVKTVVAKPAPKAKASVKTPAKMLVAAVQKKAATKTPLAKAVKPTSKSPTPPVAKAATAKSKPVASTVVTNPSLSKKKSEPVTRVVESPNPVKQAAKPVKVKPAAPSVAPAKAVNELGVPVRSGRPSARLAQLTVPSMAQSVASTAAKASFTQMTTNQAIVSPLASAVKKDPKLANNWKKKSVEQLTDEEVIAMPDQEYMNDTQMAYFRLKLVNLKKAILSSAGETTEHLREDTVVVPDPADRATIEEEHALELRTRDRERKLLKKIDQSINRIDAGDYGYCDETGEPIGVARLLARPTATLSLEAQQRRELKQKMFGD